MRFASLLIASVLVFLTGISVFAEKSYDISAFGDHSLWVLTNDIKEDFQKDTGISLHLMPEFAIGGKGCAKGILYAASGTPDMDFGLICCDLNDETIKEYSLEVYPVAVEPLAIIVNKGNPVSGLTLHQVKGIFSGKITNWKEVGGRDEKIAVITRLHCKEHIPNWTRILPEPQKFKAKRVDVSSEPDMARTVSDFKNAIGHLEMTSVMELKYNIKIIAVDGHMPTSENLKDGLYPFHATLSVVTKGWAGDKVMRFINYMRTSPGAFNAMQKYGMYQKQ